MLHNRFAGDALKKTDRFYEAGISMNGQIVLCKGINDGKELEYSLEKLSVYAPVLQSVSVVPVGLTKFREGLYPLEPFEKEDALKVLETIHLCSKKCSRNTGSILSMLLTNGTFWQGWSIRRRNGTTGISSLKTAWDAAAS